MDIIRKYFDHISDGFKKKGLTDNYKIVTVNDRLYEHIFLPYNPTDRILNSQTLIRTLLLENSDYSVIYHGLDVLRPTTKKYIDKVIEISKDLYEDRIFFNFDPYINFLLDGSSGTKDIKDIIGKTTGYYKKSNTGYKYDFSNTVNPYGLEKVVFTGGGTKGLIYIGTTIGLFITGQFYYLNHFAGTSIGALTAMVVGSISPTVQGYDVIRRMTLNNILANKSMITRYRRAISFMIDRFVARDIESFYTKPSYTWYGIWTAIDKIVKDTGLYDPVRSGFQIWYALVCKKLCQIMGNGLDQLIVIKKSNGQYVEFDSDRGSNDENNISNTVTQENETMVQEKKININDSPKNNKNNGNPVSNDLIDGIDYDNGDFRGWVLERFFTFQEYHEKTGKTLVLTGTKTSRLETVYYTDTDPLYKDLSVMDGAIASISIPWVFKAPIINGSYHLDGGVYDNFPLTHCDKMVKGKITHYNNKIFGYLIDDKNSVIDAYEIIRECWMSYSGFIDSMNIGFLKDSDNYLEITELFFEIRLEFFRLLYGTHTELQTFMNLPDDEEISGFGIRGLERVFEKLNLHAETSGYIKFSLPGQGIGFVTDCLNELDSHLYDKDEVCFKIGKKTNLSDVFEMSIRQGDAYNRLTCLIIADKQIIKSMKIKISVVIEYEKYLDSLMKHILTYYEPKGTFIKNNDLEYPCEYFTDMIERLHKKITKFLKLTDDATTEINKKNGSVEKNYMSDTINIASAMISKILTRSHSDIEIEKKSSYQRIMDYFFHTDMTGIVYKYMCIANDRICNDSFNQMRTIKLNTFETSVLHFDMGVDLKGRLIYEGYSKTIKYFTNLLHIMEITGKGRGGDEYLESYETRYKKMF